MATIDPWPDEENTWTHKHYERNNGDSQYKVTNEEGSDDAIKKILDLLNMKGKTESNL